MVIREKNYKLITPLAALFICAVIFTGGCGGWSEAGPPAVSGEAARPSVISVSPVNGAAGVTIDRVLSATFSAEMDQSTINAASFTLALGGKAVAGDVTYFSDSRTAYFSPRVPLADGATYTAAITTSARDFTGGYLPRGFVWTFTTAAASGASDTVAPSVISVSPSDASNGVALNQKLTVIFSEAVDPSTVASSSFTLKNMTAGGIFVTGYVSCSGTSAVFLPAADLANGSLYAASVSAFVRDPAGNAMAGNFNWSFTTAPAGAASVDDIMGEYPNNPALNPVENAYYPSVLFDGIVYRMWYDDGNGELRYTTSADGVKWADGTLTGGLLNARHPVVESINGKYMIWYWDAEQSNTINTIRTAESADGINWTADEVIAQVGSSVINTGWNNGGRGFSDVFYNPSGSPGIVPPMEASTVWMNKFVAYYYCSYGTGLAVSADGKLWYGYKDGVTPVFSVGEPGAWDSGTVTAGSVLKIGATYHMWYGGGLYGNNEGIGHAVSDDGVVWARSAANPVLHRDNSVAWRSTRTYTPMVIALAGAAGFKMWYTGLDPSGNYSIGYATLNASGDSLREH